MPTPGARWPAQILNIPLQKVRTCWSKSITIGFFFGEQQECHYRTNASARLRCQGLESRFFWLGGQVNIKRDRRATLIHPIAGIKTLLIGFINWAFWSAFSSEELGKKRRWSREWLSVPSQWLPVWFLLINPFWSVGFDALLVLGKSSEEETQGSGVGAALSSVPVIAVSK